ncbi:concanavalin A-like lectin/glucanase domain-containing protein [Chaetomidium leptoderma]|uniref:Concanavalin A-like lectin/glucanase domain-containing protein n=1 Tax=Chaetomidium leptoderma TaxID=669021 RepID=A0AAN6VBW5_9PEZI|nr:concanavalin A-like lectin/glucanase domain-containing protein [Chaetomidium leptoderma]
MVAINLSRAVGVAVLAGFRNIGSLTFEGGAGQAVDTAQWNIITNVHYNNEVQEYTTSTEHLQLSGNGTLQIIPRKSASGQWTSGRIESTATYTPEDGKVTRFQAALRFGDGPKSEQQGIWPAFWMLGESSRQGTPWPECGELDIMERINGELEGHGTPHCGPGDVPCGAMTKTVPLPDNGWHTWSIDVDRSDKDWKAQSITWMLDETKYNHVTGADMKDEGIWKSVAHSPLYFILNVAVGGDWPGKPNDKTVDGLKSMMEVQYIAVYSST